MTIVVRKGRLDPVVTPAPTQPLQLGIPEVSEQELNSEVELLRDQEILRAVVKDAGLSGQSTIWSAWGEDNRDARIERSVQRLARRLNVQPVRKTTLIAVSYASSNPAQAAEVLRCLASRYLEKRQHLQRPSGQSEFFEHQVEESARALDRAEGDLLRFSRNDGVVEAAAQRDLSLQKLSEAEAGYLQVKIESAATEERVRALSGDVEALPQTTISAMRVSDNPELLQKLKSTLLDLQLKRIELLTKFRPAYRQVQEVEEQIRQADAAIAAERLMPLHDQTASPNPDYQWGEGELLKTQVELRALTAKAAAAGQVVSRYRQVASRFGEQAVVQEQLLRNVKAAEDKYLLYVNKREEARIGDALDAGGILNVAVAEPPVTPVLPARSKFLWTVLALISAGIAGTGAGFGADYLNPCFRNPNEVAVCLGAPVLASLPSQKRLRA